MAVPKKLYRYRSGSTNDIVALSGAKLWFSSPTAFNDPFDCAYDVQIPGLDRAACIKVLDRITDGNGIGIADKVGNDDLLREKVAIGLRAVVSDSISNINGVCCFSAISNNLLMWGHYCNSHHGFCLEFDTENEPLFKLARPVQYSDSFPTVGPEAFTSGDFKQVLQLLLTKAKCWEYEQEWRVFHRDAGKPFGYKRECLTGVYFGAKMSEEQMLMIMKLLDRTDTKFYRMRLSKSAFELTAEPVLFTALDYRKAAGAGATLGAFLAAGK